MTDKEREQGKRATMMDVARLSGVSQATVSMVLNKAGGVRVNAETRERVLEAAEALNYRVWRRTPVGSGSIRIIGFLIDDIAARLLTVASIEAAREAAWAAGCMLVVIPIHGQADLEQAAIEFLLGQRLVGVIYGAFYTREVDLPKALRTAPVVLLNCFSSDPNLLAYVPDHEAGAYLATDHLIGLGHHDIAYINGSSTMLASSLRLRGYQRALADHGIALDPTLIADGDWSLSVAQSLTAQFLSRPVPPTAIFCASDRMAIGSYEALAGAGRHIPDDISVVGFDNDPVAQHLSPTLTTIYVPHAEMGRKAVDYLLDRYEGREPEQLSGIVTLPCPLLDRGSVAPVS